MRLKEISVHALSTNKQSVRFNKETWCVSEMYWRLLGRLDTESTAKINIILGKNRAKESLGSVCSVYKEFDFKAYFNSSIKKKKRLILEVIHNELLLLSNELGLYKEKLITAYNDCLTAELENRWLLKNKLFRSPNPIFFGAIESYWDIHFFTVKAVIFNSKKKKLKEYTLMKIEPFLGEFIYYSKCGWDGDSFNLKNKEGKIWQINCSDLASIQE